MEPELKNFLFRELSIYAKRIEDAMPRYQICSHGYRLFRLDVRTGKVERILERGQEEVPT